MKSIYEKFEILIPFSIFIIVWVIMLIQIFSRSFFNYSIPSSIEICRFSLVFLTFLGAGYVRRKNAHIRIEAISNAIEKNLPPLWQLLFWMTKQFIVIAFVLIIIFWSYEYAIKAKNILSPALNLPMFWVYISVCIGFVGYLIRELLDTYSEFKIISGGLRK